MNIEQLLEAHSTLSTADLLAGAAAICAASGIFVASGLAAAASGSGHWLPKLRLPLQIAVMLSILFAPSGGAAVFAHSAVHDAYAEGVQITRAEACERASALAVEGGVTGDQVLDVINTCGSKQVVANAIASDSRQASRALSLAQATD